MHTGWFSVRFDPDANRLGLQVSDSLLPVLPAVIWRVRALFDLDAHPQAINSVLHADFPEGDGLRVPGCFDGFELAVRAILGQQITVAAARTLAIRLTEQLGDAITTPHPPLHRLFPTAQALASVSANTLGELGIVRQRQEALMSLARAVLEGSLVLNAHADVRTTTQTLQALPGIGPWTAQYIAMRALRWPDAWPEGDVALIKALGIEGRGRAATLEAGRDQLAPDVRQLVQLGNDALQWPRGGEQLAVQLDDVGLELGQIAIVFGILIVLFILLKIFKVNQFKFKINL